MKNEADFLKLLRTLPDATRTKRRDPVTVRELKRTQPTIGAAQYGNIPLPKGHAEELNPQHGVTAGDILEGIVPVRQAFKAGQATAQAMNEGKPLAAGATLLAASPMMLPEGGPLGKLVGKIGGKAMRSFLDNTIDFENLPSRFAILTAENPGGASISKEANEANMASLKKYLDKRGIKYTQGLGRYQDNASGNVLNENSLILHNVGEREAKLLGRRYGQNGVITHGGYHDLTSGQTFPITGKPSLANDLPYTELPNGQRFALPIDWDNPVQSKINAIPVPKSFNPEVARITREMSERSGGRNLPRVKAVDPEAAKHMAKVYESLPVNDPAARESYDALNKEVAQQFKDLQDQGYKFEFTKEDPYKSSKEMAADVQQNRRLKVFATPDDSFHPYMTPEQNNQFRAVHDLLAHAGEGHQFGPKGEENAYRVHMSTLSPAAQRALATETRGQNSWVNFGPNSSLPASERPFAEQKAALWPENLLGDYGEMNVPRPMTEQQLSQWRGIQDYLKERNAAQRGYSQTKRAIENVPAAPTHDPYVRPGVEDMAIPASVKGGPRIVGDSVVSKARERAIRTKDGDVIKQSDFPSAISHLDLASQYLDSKGKPWSALRETFGGPENVGGWYDSKGYVVDDVFKSLKGDSVVAKPFNAAVRSLNQSLKLTKEPLGAAASFKDTPRAVRARADAAWAATREPVPTDRPTPRGLLVDRSRIAPDEGVSGPLPERQQFGPRAASGHLKGVNSDEQLALTRAQIERGERMMPSTFYPSARAWLDAIGNAGGDVPMFHNATTAAAIRSGVPDELVSGQAMYWAMKQGIVSPEEMAAAKDPKTMESLMRRIRDAHQERYPDAQRLRLMGAHGTAYNNLTNGTSGAYKIPLYGDQKLDNVSGAVLDTHGAKSNTVFSPYSRYFADQGGFSNPEYGVVERLGLRPVAAEMGISDRRAQEAQWRGAGNFTGLRTPPNQDYGQIAEDLVLNHARLTNQDPRRAMERIARGQEPMFFPKKLTLFDQ